MKDRSSNKVSYNEIVRIQSEFNPNLFIAATDEKAMVFNKSSKENNSFTMFNLKKVEPHLVRHVNEIASMYY